MLARFSSIVPLANCGSTRVISDPVSTNSRAVLSLTRTVTKIRVPSIFSGTVRVCAPTGDASSTSGRAMAIIADIIWRFLSKFDLKLGPGSDCTSWTLCSPIPARVVVRIDIVELERRLAVDLYDGLSASHSEVVHVRVKKGKATGRECSHFVGFELIPHADFERSGNDRDVFAIRVPMRGNAEPIRHL